MGLTERLTNISRGTQSVADYLGTIQAIADDLAMIDQPVSNAHLVNHVLNGIGAEYKEISAAVRARDSIISFEELHDKLIDYESYLKREESRNNASITANAARFSQPKYGNQGKKHNPSYSNNQSSGPGQRQTTLWTNNNAGSNKGPHPYANVICQFCDKKGHTARVCRSAKRIMSQPTANLTTTTSGGTHNSNWLLDSEASHHVTSDFNNLSLYQPYDGPDDIVIGDGTGLHIIHTGSSKLSIPSKNFSLANVLCVPSMHQNLISVSQFCKTNQTSIEFFPSFFLCEGPNYGDNSHARKE